MRRGEVTPIPVGSRAADAGRAYKSAVITAIMLKHMLSEFRSAPATTRNRLSRASLLAFLATLSFVPNLGSSVYLEFSRGVGVGEPVTLTGSPSVKRRGVNVLFLLTP